MKRFIPTSPDRKLLYQITAFSHSLDPKWSFVGLDAEGWVTRVVEKQVISDEATVGIYCSDAFTPFMRTSTRFLFLHQFFQTRLTPPSGSMHYNFARGTDFVRGAERMIAAGKRVNGEFYVAPVYEALIADGAHVTIMNVGREADGMYGLRVPADLDLFLSLPVSRRAVPA